MKKRFIGTLFLIFLILSLGFLLSYFYYNHPVKITKENVWSIGIYVGRSPFHFFDPLNVKNPVISAGDVKDVKASFVADPFLYKKDNVWYLFFEVFNSLSNHGDIGLAKSNNGFDWTYEKLILNEDYHLSYPYVFESDSTIYMIPESSTEDELNLFKATEFPYKWECLKTLITGQFGDHGIIKYKDTWWLFVCSSPLTHNTLRLFYADDLLGEWKEHPKSPIVNDDANMARPGGRVILWRNMLIRYAQDCEPTYGKSLDAYEITRLTKDDYSERKSTWNPVLAEGQSDWTRHGMHHIDAHKIEEKMWIAGVDGYVRKFIIKVDF